MIKKILESITKESITVTQWLKALIGIVFIRFLLEAYSNHSPYYTATDFIIAQDFSTAIHLFNFFLATALGIMLIIYFFTKYQPVYKIILFGFIIIWFAPLFDIISTGGKGVLMTYFFNNNTKLFSNFYSFFYPQIVQGVTLGIRVEVFLALLGIGVLVWLLKKNIKTVILTTVISFILIFVFLALPGVIYTVSHPTLAATTDAQTRNFIVDSISHSNLRLNTIHGNLEAKTSFGLYELGFDKLLSQFFYLFAVIFAGIWFYKTQKEKFFTVIKNSRLERVFFYLALLMFGMAYAYKLSLGSPINWVDIMSIIVLVISWYSAWMFSVHTNDAADVETDNISNPERPITSNKLTVAEMEESGYIWLAMSLLGSFSVGYCPFFLNIIFIAAYYIYSAPPLRLKRVPILSSFLISLACLSTILAGFFFISANKVAVTFPVMLALGVITVFTLAVNIRDLKDVAGDKAEGVNTLPVLFEKNGPKIVGALFVLSFFLTPLFLSFYMLYVFAIPAGIVGYILVTRNPYQEKYIFDLFFVFILLTAILYIVI